VTVFAQKTIAQLCYARSVFCSFHIAVPFVACLGVLRPEWRFQDAAFGIGQPSCGFFQAGTDAARPARYGEKPHAPRTARIIAQRIAITGTQQAAKGSKRKNPDQTSRFPKRI